MVLTPLGRKADPSMYDWRAPTLEPRLETYEVILQGAGTHGQPELAIEIMKEMGNAGYNHHPT